MKASALVVGALVGGAVAGPALVARARTAPVRRRLAVLGGSSARRRLSRSSRPAHRVEGHPRLGDVDSLALAGFAVGHLGRGLRRVLGRPPDDGADRRAGIALAVGLLVAVVLTPTVGVAAGAVAWGVPSVRRRRRSHRREVAVRAVLPDVVDLFRLAVGAGLSVHQCVEVVAPRAPEPVGAVLDEVRRQVALGVRLGDALAELDALGDAARPLASALVGAARYGSPLALALDRVVVDARLLRRRRAEEQARRLPVQLLFPLVMCVLPAFGLLAVVPLLAGALPSLGEPSP